MYKFTLLSSKRPADYSHEPGRVTTPLVDTAAEDWVLRAFDVGWFSLRRGQDYYDEGALIWLRADTIIREQTRGRRSLDDFFRSFLGQRDPEPVVVPYTREEVEAALSAICPFDWHTFFETRVYKVNDKPPIDGLEAAGWRLVYNATPNNEPFYSDLLPMSYFGDYSIGISVRKDGTIFDVLAGTPGYEAGLGPNMTIVAVDGHVYSADALNEAIAHPRNGKISLLVRNSDSVETHENSICGGRTLPLLTQLPQFFRMSFLGASSSSPLPDFCPSLPLISPVSVFGFLVKRLAICLWWVIVRLLMSRSGVPFSSRGTHFLASSITGISGGQLYRTGTSEQPTPALVWPSIRSCRHSPCA
jgi:hypothetical protein